MLRPRKYMGVPAEPEWYKHPPPGVFIDVWIITGSQPEVYIRRTSPPIQSKWWSSSSESQLAVICLGRSGSKRSEANTRAPQRAVWFILYTKMIIKCSCTIDGPKCLLLYSLPTAMQLYWESFEHEWNSVDILVGANQSLHGQIWEWPDLTQY